MATFAGYQKASGNLWRYDMKTGAVEAMKADRREVIRTSALAGRQVT
jgi:hypothetical protein